QVLINGQDVSKKSIRARNLSGLAHIPEDRHKHGLILDYTLEDNLILKQYFNPEYQKHGLRLLPKIHSYAEGLIERFDIRSGQGAITLTRSMSGGNQQKAIVAREIDYNPDILIAVQPTRGLDVGAIEYIHKQLIAQRNSGKAILLISLELDEVMNISDRILVIYEGSIVGEFNPKDITVQELGLYMAGSKAREVNHG
ncbi:MAG TPA: heme ABC transporter ATP-binding protein, partial [Clostridia bacterium]|nr:heme ABC transporter ATP-binding protein [Clostridia bacterium]